MREFSRGYGVDLRVCAAVTAALSPQCEWSRNLIAAENILAGRSWSGAGPYVVNVRKAETLYRERSHDLTTVFKFAPKVASFACNLAGDYGPVTVDTHAAQAAHLNPRLLPRLDTPKGYQTIADAYVDAATIAGIAPAHFQATVWLTWKRLFPSSIKRHLKG
jgi:hypothetical protein